jgi:hypothetical protein
MRRQHNASAAFEPCRNALPLYSSNAMLGSAAIPECWLIS